MTGTRLNKYIASSGICSRRAADELIESGKVMVNGKVVKELGFKVEAKDKVFVEKKLIHPVKNEYYRFYKPAGYITTMDDEKGRKTIYDILPENLNHLKPAGRLDRESTGLLILTNDGELLHLLTHPTAKVPKIYLVQIESQITNSDLKELSNGIEIEPGKKAFADVEVLENSKNSTVMRITLYQGMNRQIRKMFQYLGHEVKSLKRIQHATITLEGLRRGEFKPIKPGQIKDLKNFLNRISSKNV